MVKGMMVEEGPLGSLGVVEGGADNSNFLASLIGMTMLRSVNLGKVGVTTGSSRSGGRNDEDEMVVGG
jgi:hypothetical protein